MLLLVIRFLRFLRLLPPFYRVFPVLLFWAAITIIMLW